MYNRLYSYCQVVNCGSYTYFLSILKSNAAARISLAFSLMTASSP